LTIAFSVRITLWPPFPPDYPFLLLVLDFEPDDALNNMAYFGSMSITSKGLIVDAPIESVKVISIKYFPALSEAIGLNTNVIVSLSSFMKEGILGFDYSKQLIVIT
jgi:hypothetical protein